MQLDFQSPAIKSLTYKLNSTLYGECYWREIGEINLFKASTKYPEWTEKYHPRTFFISHGMKNLLDQEFLTMDEIIKLPPEDIDKYFTYKISIPFREDNPDWYKNNKEFIKKNNPDYKVKEYPGHERESFIAWYANSLEVITDEWKERHADFVKEISSVIETEYQNFFTAVENEDMKGVRKAQVLQLNLKRDNQKALHIAIEKANLPMVKYFIGKKFDISRDLLEKAQSNEIKEALLKVVEADEKRLNKQNARAIKNMRK